MQKRKILFTLLISIILAVSCSNNSTSLGGRNISRFSDEKLKKEWINARLQLMRFKYDGETFSTINTSMGVRKNLIVEEIVWESESEGIILGKFEKNADNPPSVGKYSACAFKDLTDGTVIFADAQDYDDKANTIEDAKKLFNKQYFIDIDDYQKYNAAK